MWKMLFHRLHIKMMPFINLLELSHKLCDIIRITLSILTSLATPTHREFSMSILKNDEWVSLKMSGLKEIFGNDIINGLQNRPKNRDSSFESKVMIEISSLHFKILKK